MKYKVGDVVKLKTLKEKGMILQDKKVKEILNSFERYIPQNRIVTLRNEYGKDLCFIGEGDTVWYVSQDMIKCFANECYLQEIKDEL